MATELPTTDPWRIDVADYPIDGSLVDRIRFLIGYAILAPSSHNTEPWKFQVQDKQLRILLDFSRWLRVADDDQRELHISVGCAIENLLIAAQHFGLAYESVLLPDTNDPAVVATVTFREPGQSISSASSVLFDMMTVRHTNHQHYDERTLPDHILQQLQATCTEDDIRLHLTADPEIKKCVDQLVVRSDAIEFADPKFREELGYWIGQGVFGTGWLMSKIGKLAVSYIDMGKSQAKKDSDVLMSSPIVGMICSQHDDRQSQVRVGQIYQRLSLLAASHGIWCQPISQIVQIPETKAEVASLNPWAGLVPQHPFRMGYAPAEKQHTPRRPIQEVLV